MYTLKNVTNACYDSMPDYVAAPASGRGSLPTWAKALIGGLAGCAALALGLLLFWWCSYRRRPQRELAAVDEEQGSKSGSTGDLASLPSGKPASHIVKRDNLSCSCTTSLSGQPNSELQRSFLRTRFGPIDGVQLGHLLGRGGFGRVYKGEPCWLLPAACTSCARPWPDLGCQFKGGGMLRLAGGCG